jgi:hypothetical protein
MIHIYSAAIISASYVNLLLYDNLVEELIRAGLIIQRCNELGVSIN